jgi:peptidyl-prolyl cis-trans isomerase SurA
MTAFVRMLVAGSMGLAIAGAAQVSQAQAQAVIATVNDDPITNVDIDQHMKMLRILRKPATKEAAMEDVISTRLKLMETSKYKMSAGNQDIGLALNIAGKPLKMDAQQLATTLHNSGISDDQWQQKFKAEAAWMMYIRALNRSLEVSETAVRSELTKENKTRGLEYTLRQVIIVVPASAGMAGLQSKMAQAQSLRARFTSCDTGVDMARNSPDTAVRDPMRRTEAAISAEMNKLLQQTPVGHLTPPSRGPAGIEMYAVCNKVERTDTSAEENVRNDLLTSKLDGASDEKYRELRSKAIIVKK